MNKRKSLLQTLFDKPNFLIEALKSQFTSEYGKSNFMGELLMTALAIVYTSSDFFKQLLYITHSTILSWRLNKEIHYPYKETSYITIITPVVIAFILCLIYCSYQEHLKNMKSE